LKVVHITPTYFDEFSVIGGGERYPTELSAWMAKSVDTTLVSFSAELQSYRQDGLKIEVYPVRRFIHGNKINPLSLRYLSAIREADIVHLHHIHTLVSDVACLVSSFFRKPTFITDYGGGGSLVLNQRLPVLGCYRKAIAYSRYGAALLPGELRRKTILIKGGVDTTRFCPDKSYSRGKTILYVGRLLPHKGIDYLVDAFRLLNRPDLTLRILGRVYSENVFRHLKQQSEGLRVEFVHDADDRRLVEEYRTALVTVLPSVHQSYDGNYTSVPELMGLTLLESQACGTPVVCTDAGAMREFVDDGQTGLVVEQNSGRALAAALSTIIDTSPAETVRREARCREWVAQFDWSRVVTEYLKVYREALSARSRSRAA
jgi:glycosyltransferase involved in cell wall biosynthesis